jgi:hypothetical protein
MLKKGFMLALYGSIFIFGSACTQEKKTKIKTEQKMTNEALPKVNSYKEHPYYAVQINKGGCTFETLVNDLHHYSYMKKGGFTSLVPLNLNILKSGKQLLKLKVYPDQGKTKFDDGSYIDIEVRFFKDVNDPTTEFTSVLKFSLPKEAKDKGLPYFEVELPFTATVPYDHSERLLNAQVIKKDKQTEEKIIAAYNHARNLIEKLDAASLNKLTDERDHILADVFYYSPQQTQALMASTKDNLEPEAKVQPVADYQIVYYAGGKVVSLERRSDKGPILHSILNEGKPTREVIDFDWMLYLPKGSTEFRVF